MLILIIDHLKYPLFSSNFNQTLKFIQGFIKMAASQWVIFWCDLADEVEVSPRHASHMRQKADVGMGFFFEAAGRHKRSLCNERSRCGLDNLLISFCSLLCSFVHPGINHI